MSLVDEVRLIDAAKPLFADPRKFGWNLVSTRITQFPYFDQILGRPRWKEKNILDFGGNVGTFLESAGERVDHERYWCVDLNRVVVEQGRLTWPRAHFIHFNRYGPQYNPDGIRHLPVPDCGGVRFDFILAFSVFTHVDLFEMLELVHSLRAMLAEGGVLAFTFFDGWNALKLFAPEGESERARRARWLIHLDGRVYLEPGIELCHQDRTGAPLESYCSFFAAPFMQSLFPDAEIHEPVAGEWQHCCVIRA
jgi:hypothetical protein